MLARCLGAVFLLSAMVLSAQQASVPLVPEETVETPEVASSLLLPVKCDQEGNIYFRRSQMSGAFFAPIVKLSPDGKRSVLFDINQAPLETRGSIRDFATDRYGDLHVLVDRGRRGVSVVTFNADGRYRGATKIEPPIRPEKLAVFPSGQFFISGTQEPATGKPKSGKPVNLITDNAGSHAVHVVLENDVQPEKGDTENLGVVLGGVATGPDGNVYLWRKGPETPVYVISPMGEVLRTLKLAPKDSKDEPLSMNLFHNQIVIVFQTESTTPAGTNQRFSAFDASTGELISSYETHPLLGAALACYTFDRVTFLGTRKNKVTISTARIH